MSYLHRYIPHLHLFLSTAIYKLQNWRHADGAVKCDIYTFFVFYPQACPIPDITWLKDGFPVAKHVTIIDLEKVSQLFIHTSELSDTGIYTVTVKNVVGQDTFTIEIRVTGNSTPFISILILVSFTLERGNEYQKIIIITRYPT